MCEKRGRKLIRTSYTQKSYKQLPDNGPDTENIILLKNNVVEPIELINVEVGGKDIIPSPLSEPFNV